MLKFVKNIKKSSKSDEDNASNNSKKTIAQDNALEENDIDLTINDTQQTEPKQEEIKSKKLNDKFNRKKLRLIITSGILVFLAIIILVALLVCVIKFTGVEAPKQNRTTLVSSNSNFYDQNLIDLNNNCNEFYECRSGYYSILINNECSCHIFKQNNMFQERLICAKIKDYMYKCDCRTGYQWSNYDSECIDVNECEFDTICLDSFSSGCINKIGSYECACKEGFKWSDLFQRCTDINECKLNGDHLCPIENTVCVNTYGSYRCDCVAGYYKFDNKTHFECLDINECNTSRFTCTNSTCNNLPGSYECCKVFDQEYECINCGYQFYKPLLNSTTNFSTNGVSRIIGGIESNPYSWPWIVSIGFTYKYHILDPIQNSLITKWLNISHICGGTLISPYTVLTAAHCLYNLQQRINSNAVSNLNKTDYLDDLANIVIVYAGIHDQRLDKQNRNYTYRLRKIYIHEEFDSRMFLNDIALLILDKSVRKSYRVNWACMGDFLNFKFPEINTTLFAAGFGTTNQTNTLLGSNFLRQVDLTLLKFDDCSRVTNSMISKPESQFCAGYLNGVKDTCTGDSGSPILYSYRRRWFVVGIVSYGQGCAQSFKPGINTNVSYYLDWIHERIKL